MGHASKWPFLGLNFEQEQPACSQIFECQSMFHYDNLWSVFLKAPSNETARQIFIL